MDEVPASALYDQAELFDRVEKRVVAGDTMWAGNDPHYFSVGASALSIVRRALRIAGRDEGSIGRVLDYACGYGRVARWLRAAFPDARVVGVDAHGPSVDGAREIGVEARREDVRIDADLGERFDLIWVGSLLTHLSEADCRAALSYLKRHLAEGGVLVVTTHGWLVRDRLDSGENLYGLLEDAAADVLRGWRETGYGYADYVNQTGYGISAATPLAMTRLLVDCGLVPFMFQPAEWDRHQDVFACRVDR